MAKKIVEKHISVTKEKHEKLKKIADKERRSMRTVVSRLIDEEGKKHGL